MLPPAAGLVIEQRHSTRRAQINSVSNLDEVDRARRLEAVADEKTSIDWRLSVTIFFRSRDGSRTAWVASIVPRVWTPWVAGQLWRAPTVSVGGE